MNLWTTTITLMVSFTLLSCGTNDTNSAQPQTFLKDQKFSSASFTLQGAVDSVESFSGAVSDSNRLISGTFCSRRDQGLEIRVSHFEKLSDAFTMLTKSFVITDPTATYLDGGNVTLTNDMLGDDSNKKAIFEIFLLDKDNTDKTSSFLSKDCSITYGRNDEALLGSISCDQLDDEQSGDSISIVGQFSCDWNALNLVFN